MGIATACGMRTTQQQRTALFVGVAAAGALMAARAWRRRHAYDFAGKSVVITGGSRGLGLVMARALAGEGARLSLIARDQDALTRAADDIRGRQPFADVLTIAADVRQQQDVERAIAQVVERFGRVDVLINNAGIIQTGPVDHMTVADYQDAMNTHFWGPLYATMAALPHMRDRGEGRIVNISSIGGRISVPHLVPYSASKFALVGLSDGLRAELAPDNIIVTTVCPGLMRTGSPENAMFKGQHAKEYAWFAISDSLPLASIDADRAGRQIVEACRRGDAELVVTVQAKLAILARTVAPELFGDAMALMNRLLPDPSPRASGDEARPGRDSESAWAPSVLTTLTQSAAQENNERP
jgi:NAD(P)-dependent dehydrogenase (short-subunit alcohol dehydrogenase family)